VSTSLIERLGHPADARLVILNLDDFGAMHATNVGIIDALRSGAASTTTLMVPCPWAAEAASMLEPGDDVGVHLTVTSEWAAYRWGPLTGSRVLCAADGRMHRTVDACHQAVVAAGSTGFGELRAECRAQIEQALAWGVDVSHLDAHMGVMQTHPEFLDVYLHLAAEYALPLRMLSAGAEQHLGLSGRVAAAERGLVFPDHMLMTYLDARPTIESGLASLRPGVTEFLLHPSLDSEELRVACKDAEERVANQSFLMGPGSFAEQVAAHGATMIGYRALRDLQRGLVAA